MNAIRMFFQQMQSTKLPSVSDKVASKSDMFQNLLNNEHGNGQNSSGSILLSGKKGNSPLEITLGSEQKQESNLMQPGLSIVIQSSEQEGMPTVELSEEEQNKLIDLVTTLLNTGQSQERLEVALNELNMLPNVPPVLKEFVQVIKEITPILSQIYSKQDAEKAAPKLLHSLQQWESLEKKNGAAKSGEIVLNILKKENPDLQGVWKELLQSFEKRSQMATKQQYNADAKVTSTDVAKWVTNAMEQLSQPVIKSNGHAAVSGLNGPLSQIEQYVIHVSPSQSSKAPDKQLMDQFQQMIHSSKFATKFNGATQLSISLRPENLGDMMVKLTQINGEMTVKILVSSQAAKDMMEGNLHQLRNMFSPHQVVIEKQDLSIQQSQNIQKEHDSQHFDQQENRSEDTWQEEDQSSEDDFATQFHELLMNEKV
ncbi:flagellar hook-length control protein FliK [Oceanobacillus kapialis]|uniref:flagellar hook-length control protein FliK n=1 Tax=Oceanobacillus kapialis TaxID=481353 RepID=UPI00384CB0AC